MSTSPAVDAWFSELRHPLKPIMLRVREINLSLDHRISELVEYETVHFNSGTGMASLAQVNDPNRVSRQPGRPNACVGKAPYCGGHVAGAYCRCVVLFHGRLLFCAVLILATGCESGAQASAGQAATVVPVTATPAVATLAERDANVPELPFPDNPDPNQCGIPTPFGGGAGWLNGVYDGRVVEPTVLLYDSHERLHVTGAVPSGTHVQVELYQSNPVLDFYYVRADTADGPQQGWVPAPFLQLDQPSS